MSYTPTEGDVCTIFDTGPFCNETGTVIMVSGRTVQVLVDNGLVWTGDIRHIAPDHWQN